MGSFCGQGPPAQCHSSCTPKILQIPPDELQRKVHSALTLSPVNVNVGKIASHLPFLPSRAVQY